MGSQVYVYGDEGRGLWCPGVCLFIYVSTFPRHTHTIQFPTRSSGGARPTSQSSEAGRNTPAVISRCDLSDTPSTAGCHTAHRPRSGGADPG